MVDLRGPLFLGLLSLGGCHDFRSIEVDGRCGNGVLEPESGEDCDGHPTGGGTCGDSNSAAACRFICEPEAPACPAGYGCGHDGICRAPAGAFEQATVLPIAGGRMQVADIDGDGRDDVVSFGNTELTVAYGDVGAGFASRITVPTPPLDADPAVGKLNEDKAFDIVLPLQSGPQIVLGQASRTPLPVAIATPLDTEGDVVVVPTRAEAPYELDQLLLIDDGRFTGVDRTVVATEVEAAMAGAPATFADRIPVARLEDQPGPDTIALAPQGHDRVYLVQLTCAGPGEACFLRLLDTLILPQGVTVLGKAFFGDFEGTGQTDLILGGRRGDEPVLMVAFNDLEGGLTPPVIQPGMGEVVAVFDDPFPAARSGRLADVAQLDEAPGIDFVTLDGGFTQGKVGEPAVRKTVVNVRPWKQAVAADFNGDGHVDIAGIRPGAVDVFVQNAAGAFNQLQAPTDEGLADAIRVGDFDGDLAPDLLILENSGVLSVVFSGRQQVPSERVEMGRFDGVQEPVPALLGNSDTRLSDGIFDVVLIGKNFDGQRALYRLRGTNARRLIAPIEALGVPNTYQIGRFGPGGAAALAMKEDLPSGPPTGGGPSAPPAGFRLGIAQDAVEGRRTSPPVLATGDGCDEDINRRFTLGAAYDLEGDGQDEWFVIQKHASADTVTVGEARDWYPSILHFEGDHLRCQVLPPIRHSFAPSSPPLLVDLDGDGRRDLVAPLSRRLDDDATGGAGIAIWWGGEPFEAPVFLPVNEGHEISLQIEALEIDEHPGPDLMVADSRGLSRVQVHADRRLEETPFDESATHGAAALRRLDANQDGLEDLAIGTANEVFILLQQVCDARKAASGQCTRVESP